MKQAIWTDADFPEMSWHDCHIHSIGWDQDGEYQNDLVFDIDYIVEWIPDSDNSFRFRVAPAQLRFTEVDKLKMNIFLPFKDSLEIAMINRDGLSAKGFTEYHWIIGIHHYPDEDPNVIEFNAAGFTQELTGRSVVIDSRSLTNIERTQLKEKMQK
jgi:hypothetical protein